MKNNILLVLVFNINVVKESGEISLARMCRVRIKTESFNTVPPCGHPAFLAVLSSPVLVWTSGIVHLNVNKHK